MTRSIRIALALGDGIGPEIMDAVLLIISEAKCPLEYDEIKMGKEVFDRGILSGIDESAWEIIKRNKVLLKGPITTPQGGGYKSINVTLRKSLGLFANIRPCISFHPYVKAISPKLRCVVFRENEEDLYAGIEYHQTDDSFHAIKLISKQGTERIIRLAFQFAQKSGLKKVTCVTKDNILKLTDGYFHSRFKEIAKEYPDIQADHMIVDIGSAKLFSASDRFEVIVTLNLYGDILSDIAAEASGSIGLAGSANLGEVASMFEAVHGSAPDIAGQGVANPSGLLCSAIYMLGYLGLNDKAQLIKNAWLYTLESGIHTRDLKSDLTRQVVGTKDFAKAVIGNFGKTPKELTLLDFPKLDLNIPVEFEAQKKDFDGVDIYVDSTPEKVFDFAEKIKDENIFGFKLHFISNRGLMVWPTRIAETLLIRNFRFRFLGGELTNVPKLINFFHETHFTVTKHESLFSVKSQKLYSLAQGE